MRSERGEIGTKKEVTVVIGHGRNWCQVTTMKKIVKGRFGKAKSGISRRDTRENKRLERERETKLGGRAVAGAAVNWLVGSLQ